MITCETMELSAADQKRLRDWALRPEYDLLMRVLKSAEAQAKVQALAQMDLSANSLARGEPLPQSCTPYLRRAAELVTAQSVLAEIFSNSAKLTTSKLIIE